ncbi:MAG: DHA2 family efflux MFS transporter permease subunit [Lapillicoccus sp.]
MSQSKTSESQVAGDTRRWWTLAATATTVLVIGLDTTILNVAVPDIAVSLHASSAQLQWFADSYLLALGALLLPAGLLGDRYGRKRSTVAGLLVFFAGSLWCALATSTGSLIAARTLLGVGAAVLIPLAMSSVVVLFDAAERTRAIALLGISTMVGLPLGPIVAGILLQHFWWGSVFVVNLPVIVLALVAVVVFLPESTGSRGRPLDVVGILLTSAGMLAATFGVIEGPERGWTDPLVLGGLVGGAVLVAGFLLWQRRDRGREPVVDPVLWRNPAFRWGSLTAAVASLAFFGAMFVVPQYLRGALGEDALGTGLKSVPMVVGLFVGLRVTMVLLPRFGARVLGGSGFVVGAAGFMLGTRVGVDSGYAVTAAWTVLVGAGVGAALFCGQNGALAALPRERAAAGSALIQVLRQIGSVAGIAILGALLNAAYRSALPTGLPGELADALSRNVATGMAVAAQSGSASLEYAVRSAFVSGLTATMWISAVVGLLGAAMVWRYLPDSRVLAAHDGGPDVLGENPAESGHVDAAVPVRGGGVG